MLSGEYEYAFNETWALAGFADLGNAFDAGSSTVAKTLGTGIRWRSPVGIVRIDFAYALDDEKSPLKLHLIIGPDL